MHSRLWSLSSHLKAKFSSFPLLAGGISHQRITGFLFALAQISVILVTYPLLHALYFNLAYLPEKAYFEPFVTPQIFAQPLDLLIEVFLLTAILFLGYKRLHWHDFEQGKILKYFILFLSLVLAWTFSTYDYNLYYNQAHYLDRFLLILLGLLVWFHPAIIPIFLIQTIAIVYQFQYPLDQYSWTDKEVVFNILILFNIFLYLKLLLRRNITVLFLVLALSLFAANYFISGLGKLELDWIGKNRIYELVVSSYVNGWLAFLPETTLLQIVEMLKTFNPFMIFMTMVIELGGLVILAHKRVALLVLLSFTLLHIAIFITSGIFFWKWILLASAFFVVLQKIDEAVVKQLFNKSFFVTSLLIIYFSPHYFHPARLAWYDTGLSNFYEIEAVGVSGTLYNVGRSFMAPYDFPFAQNRFPFLSNEKLLVGTYGSTSNLEVMEALQTVKVGEELSLLEESKGRNHYNGTQARQFDYFLQSFFTNLNQRGAKTIFINHFGAPHHIWNFARGNVYALQEKVRQIRVRFIKTFYDGVHIYPLALGLTRTLTIA
jgi:hypothetical protein